MASFAVRLRDAVDPHPSALTLSAPSTRNLSPHTSRFGSASTS